MAPTPRVGPHENAISSQITVPDTLLLASQFDSLRTPAIVDLCTPHDPASLDIMYVSLTQSPTSVVNLWETHVGKQPRSFTIITANQYLNDLDSTVTAGEIQASVTYIRSPADLTALGIQLTNGTNKWDTNNTNGVFCIDSITPIKEFSGLVETFDFLQTVATKAAIQEFTVICLIDPNTTDVPTIDTLKELFDSVVNIGTAETDCIGIHQRLP